MAEASESRIHANASLAAHGADSQGGAGRCAQGPAKGEIHLALSQWNNVDYCIPFWQAMLAAEVQLDYPGLSYFPSSAKEPVQRPFNYLLRR